jgi:hypothetical protein
MEPLVRDLTPLLKAERTTCSDIAVNTGQPNMRDNANCGCESVLSYTFAILMRTSTHFCGPTIHHLPGKTFSHGHDSEIWTQSCH